MGGCLSDTSRPNLTTCQKCGKLTRQQQQNTHICQIPKPVLNPQTPQVPSPSPQLATIASKAIPDQKSIIKIKTPVDKTNTKYEWKQQKSLIYPPEIKKISVDVIKNASFQEKLAWFRYHLESKRVSWEKGSEVLKVDRWNILFSSLNGLKDKNLYKELKIQFTDQKVDDAGGLLREWMHLCIKQIMSKQTGIFKLCNSTQTAYHIVWDKTLVPQLTIESLTLLGTIIGKAIFQRISLNCYLDYTILRQLCSQSVHLSDVYSYDKDMYRSWAQMLVMDNARDLELDGCVYKNHGENDLEVIELFANGKNTLIGN